VSTEPNDVLAMTLAIKGEKQPTETIVLDAMAFAGDRKAGEISSRLKMAIFGLTAFGGHVPATYRRGNPNFREGSTPVAPKKTKKQLIAEKKAKKAAKKPPEQIPF
jgi:hypothetical protein